MDFLKLIVSNQMEESISIQRVKQEFIINWNYFSGKRNLSYKMSGTGEVKTRECNSKRNRKGTITGSSNKQKFSW